MHRTVAQAGSALGREADEDGSPATIEAGIWFVCLLPGIRKQWWHPLVNKTHKDAFAMRPERDGRWNFFEPWWHRPLATSLSLEHARKCLLLAVAGEVVATFANTFRAAAARSAAGRPAPGWCLVCSARPYWVWTPHRFHRLPLRELSVCRVDVLALLNLGAAEFSAATQAIASRLARAVSVNTLRRIAGGLCLP